MKIKFRRTIANYYYTILLSVFIFGIVIRRSFLSGMPGTVNMIFFFCEFVVLATALKKRKLKIMSICLGIVLIMGIVYVDVSTSSSVSSMFSSIVYIVLPLFFLDAEVLDTVDRKQFIRTLIKILNFFVVIIVAIMFCDQISGCAVTKSMASVFSYLNNYLPAATGFLQFRSNTYLGHELYNTHFIIMFYLMNMLYRSEFKEMILDTKIVHMIAILGIIFTQSKMGAILLFVAVVYFNYNSKNRVVNILLVFAGIGILYYIGLFDAIISRFQSTSFTTGRLTWLTYLSDHYGLKLQLFGGYGEELTAYFTSRLRVNYSDSWSQMIVTAAFESPFLIISYRYGLIMAILWFIKLFSGTFFVIWKSKSRAILLCFAIMIVQVIAFNQLIYNPDLLCCVLLWNIVFINFANKDKTSESGQ